MRRLIVATVVALALSVVEGQAQPVTGSALDRIPVCGSDGFIGPCLPAPLVAEEKSQAKAPAAPATDVFARTAFDEYGFGGNDPLIQAWTAGEAAGRGSGIVAAAADPEAPPQRDAVRASADRNLNEDRGDGRAEPSPHARHPGSRMDPVHTSPRPVPTGQTLVAVIAPDSATAQLNWITIRSANSPAHASEEEAHNYNSGLWDHAPSRPVTKDPNP